MSHPQTLSSLTPREAITDTLYRAVIGFDRYDTSIFNSAFTEDTIFELHVNASDKRIINGLSALRTQLLDHIGPMETTHTVSNIRVDIKDSAVTASLTAYGLAKHCPPGKGREPDAPKFLLGAEYWIDLVRDEADGVWKIKKWLLLEVIWKQGNISVML